MSYYNSSQKGKEIDQAVEYVINELPMTLKDILKFLTTLSDGKADIAYVNQKVADIVGSAPETLDALNELADALGNDPNFATTVANQIGNIAIVADEANDNSNYAVQSAQNARDIAQSVRNDADNGEFNGEDGASVFHEWDGTVLKVTSASGTSSADLKGERGYSGLVPKQTKIPTRVTNVEPNIMYEFEETTTDVEIFLGEPLSGYDNEWDFVITQGTTAYEIILPTIKWGLGIAPTFSANSTTICRLYYIGNTLCGEWVTV